ncbi:hypothetical protein OIU84_016582 [Salix udensis]|uniref:Uncharacterized protein n=1 Tax=Salix udensis TaxID=889485 RepID=A0AAD6NQF4_9ROSI|nr:hypothetical protein OIU84_016582 [Salix udensis]
MRSNSSATRSKLYVPKFTSPMRQNSRHSFKNSLVIMEKVWPASPLRHLKAVGHKSSKKPRLSTLYIKNTIAMKVAWRPRLKDRNAHSFDLCKVFQTDHRQEVSQVHGCNQHYRWTSERSY